MSNIVTLPQASYPSGTHAFGPWAVPTGLDGCQLLIARCTTATPTIWPSATQQVIFLMDLSFDGMLTWCNGLFGFTGSGGIHVDKHGTELSVSSATFRHEPRPTHVRGTIQVVNGPILTSAQFTTL